jgi:hypothetical protein
VLRRLLHLPDSLPDSIHPPLHPQYLLRLLRPRPLHLRQIPLIFNIIHPILDPKNPNNIRLLIHDQPRTLKLLPQKHLEVFSPVLTIEVGIAEVHDRVAGDMAG